MEVMSDISREEKRKAIESLLSANSHFDQYIKELVAAGWDEGPIRRSLTQAVDKVNAGVKSFVIYGEPQSGKTAMMIALTSKLIEAGHNLIIILLNDSVKLLTQNLKRFVEAKLRPTPRVATDVYGQGFAEKSYILFCKKNIHDLRKLSEMFREKEKIIIDDEADYASPNAKINQEERTAINNAIFGMINERTRYIGVTATPARLDLNNTFDTDNEHWIYFEPHRDYVGKKEIFLTKPVCQVFSVSDNEKKDLERAIIAFIVNTVYLNCENVTRKQPLENYGFLIHTSGKIIAHHSDAAIVSRVISALLDPTDKRHDGYIKEIRDYVQKHKEIEEYGTEDVIRFIQQRIPSYKIVIMNSDYDTRAESTTPVAMFTFFIGGNVVSRGVTFDNLLGMFFTRAAKYNIQQDTYIQRARMFGSRKKYIKYFQLWITDQLFEDWQRCFIYHHISLESILATETAPVWLSGGRLVPAAPSSVDKRNVFTMKGEIFSLKFCYSKVSSRMEEILNNNDIPELDRLEKIKEFIPINEFLDVIIQFIYLTSDVSRRNVNLIKSRPVGRGTDYHDTLFRLDGVMGGRDYKNINKDHHIMFIVNQNDEARMIYRYSPQKIRFFSKAGIQRGY